MGEATKQWSEAVKERGFIGAIKAYHEGMPIQTRLKLIFILVTVVIRLRISWFLDDCTRLLARFLLWALFGLKYEDYKDYED